MKRKTKDGLLALGIACAAVGFFLWAYHFQHGSNHPELLALPLAKPSWDGSSPLFVIRDLPDSSQGLLQQVSYERAAPSMHHDSPVDEFEVGLGSGKFILRQTDLFVSDAIPMSLTRTYESFDTSGRSFGTGTSQPYDACPVGSRYPYTYMDLILEDGARVHFDRISKGTGYADAVYEHIATASPEFYGARINWNGDGWDLHLPAGLTYVFPEAYAAKTLALGAAKEIHGASGQRVLLLRDADGNLVQIVSPTGHKIDIDQRQPGRIIEAREDTGETRKYSYDSEDRLQTVSDDQKILYRFTYDGDRMTNIQDGNWSNLVTNSYYSNGRIAEQRLADGAVYRFSYEFNSANQIIRTVATEPGGEQKAFQIR